MIMQIDKLHYISQPLSNGSHLHAIADALAAGGKWIQLRVKNQPENEILDLAIEGRRLCEQYGAKFIVNDHPLIAIKAKAHGMHLGLTDMPLAEARKLAGPDMIIGGTANTFEQVAQRVAEGASYIGLGPYRFTTTKQNLSPILGIEGYRVIMAKVRQAGYSLPIVAIGGISVSDIAALVDEGLHGVALSGVLTDQPGLRGIIDQVYNELRVDISNIDRTKIC
jgi:thiamine-phosphate pyrophosphorylase